MRIRFVDGWSRIVLVLAAVTSFTGLPQQVAHSQTAASDGAKTQEAIRERRSLSRRGQPVEYARLNAFLGEWESLVKMKELDWSECNGTARCEWELDGTTLACKTKMRTLDGTYKELTFISWDSPTNSYRVISLDNEGRRLIGTGTFNESEREWTIDLKSDHANPQSVESYRTVIRFKTADRYEWRTYRLNTDGQDHDLILTGDDTRRPPAADAQD